MYLPLDDGALIRTKLNLSATKSPVPVDGLLIAVGLRDHKSSKQVRRTFGDTSGSAGVGFVGAAGPDAGLHDPTSSTAMSFEGL
jgi:hypothetical protein